jgi:hypothetical protein
MKQHPILFSTPMVQAILENRKTQTRRAVKGRALEWLELGMFTPEFVALDDNELCPYGKVGDVLWVRETWAYLDFLGPEEADYVYKASDNGKEWESNSEGFKWKPSIHMPRTACRLFLKIKSVRVERLQDITNDDAFSEGIEWKIKFPEEDPNAKYYKDYGFNDRFAAGTHFKAKDSFKTLWQSINGPESWQANPWVWVIEFEKTEK